MFSECGLFEILNFLFWYRQNLVGETDVVVRLQGRFPNLAEAFSESDCGVFRMQAFCSIGFSFFRMGRIRKRRKKSLAGETNVVVCFQGHPNLAAALSE